MPNKVTLAHHFEIISNIYNLDLKWTFNKNLLRVLPTTFLVAQMQANEVSDLCTFPLIWDMILGKVLPGTKDLPGPTFTTCRGPDSVSNPERKDLDQKEEM